MTVKKVESSSTSAAVDQVPGSPLPPPPLVTKPAACTRRAEGVLCTLTDPAAPAVLVRDFSDANGWAFPEYGSTLRYGDVNGDGAIDICGRAAAGMTCRLWDGQNFRISISTGYFPDSTGWNLPQYYSTIGLADVTGDGRADICGRTTIGIRCFISEGLGFASAFLSGPPLSDAAGYGGVQYYSTIRYQDYNVDGRTDICALDPADGLNYCWISNGTAFTKMRM